MRPEIGSQFRRKRQGDCSANAAFRCKIASPAAFLYQPHGTRGDFERIGDRVGIAGGLHLELDAAVPGSWRASVLPAVGGLVAVVHGRGRPARSRVRGFSRLLGRGDSGIRGVGEDQRVTRPRRSGAGATLLVRLLTGAGSA